MSFSILVGIALQGGEKQMIHWWSRGLEKGGVTVSRKGDKMDRDRACWYIG